TDLEDQIRSGRVAKREASDFVDRNVINRALGVEREVDTEVKSLTARDGMRFLLCSDGIYRHLSDREIARVLAQVDDVQKAADELKKLVFQRGADDNLTAVVVQVGRAHQTSTVSLDDGSVSAKSASSAGSIDSFPIKSVAGGSTGAVRTARAE